MGFRNHAGHGKAETDPLRLAGHKRLVHRITYRSNRPRASVINADLDTVRILRGPEVDTAGHARRIDAVEREVDQRRSQRLAAAGDDEIPLGLMADPRASMAATRPDQITNLLQEASGGK